MQIMQSLSYLNNNKFLKLDKKTFFFLINLSYQSLPIIGISCDCGTKSAKSNRSKKNPANIFIPSIIFDGDSGGSQNTTFFLFKLFKI